MGGGEEIFSHLHFWGAGGGSLKLPYRSVLSGTNPVLCMYFVLDPDPGGGILAEEDPGEAFVNFFGFGRSEERPVDNAREGNVRPPKPPPPRWHPLTPTPL